MTELPKQPPLQRCHGRAVPAGPNAALIGGRLIDKRCMACARFLPWSKSENLYQPPGYLARDASCPGRIVSGLMGL